MNDDLISRSALRARYQAILDRGDMFCEYDIIGMLDSAPTIVSDESIVLDFTNITEEQKQQLVNLLSKTRIKAINQDVIWQNGYYACLNDKSIRESNWIPVSERLPEVAKPCIVQLCDGHITIGSYHSIDKWTFQETSVRYAYPKESVIAWQPLPEAYKEAENEYNSL